MRRIDLDVEEIVRLYEHEGLRGRAIARLMGCSDSVIYDRLAEAGICVSSTSRLDRDDVVHHYIVCEWTCAALAARYGVTSTTIARHLRMWGVPMRTQLEAQQPAGRRPCPRSPVARAYMLGFATGDLWVHRPNEQGHTIDVSCSTTHAEQVRLVRDLFSPFGPVRQRGLTVAASLGPSFGFLFDKYEPALPAWVDGDAPSVAYAAGYIDAEGSFGVYGGRGRFKLDSYDGHVVAWLHDWCATIGVRSRLLVVGRKGDDRRDGTVLNADLWRLNVNDGPSLLRFVATLDPYLRHERRRAGADRVRVNVVERLSARARDPTQ